MFFMLGWVVTECVFYVRMGGHGMCFLCWDGWSRHYDVFLFFDFLRLVYCVTNCKCLIFDCTSTLQKAIGI